MFTYTLYWVFFLFPFTGVFFYLLLQETVMDDEIRDIFEKLKFSEDESNKVLCKNIIDKEEEGCEA